MYKVIAVLVALVLMTGLSSGVAYASSWDANPLDRLDIQKRGNVSYPLDWNKHDVISPKSYGWKVSKVCGLELCIDGSNGWKQPSHLQNEQTNAPQTISPYLGLSATGDDKKIEFAVDKFFDGKFYIKGFFK
jgi:hypothetical protein